MLNTTGTNHWQYYVLCFFVIYPFASRFSITVLFVLCSEIHLDSGPKRNRSCYNFSVCRWNLNGTTVHNYEKINILKVYKTVNKFDMICISELYLDFPISPDSQQLNIKNYKLVWNDNPGNVRRAGMCVCAYFRETLLVVCISNLYLNECLIFDVPVNNKKCCVVSL